MSDREEPQDSDHLIYLRTSPGRGVGVFAKVDIPRGTRIIAESALLKMPMEDRDFEISEVMSAYFALEQYRRVLYLDLHGFISSDLERKLASPDENGKDHPMIAHKVMAIYEANTFEGGVFRLGTRLNHSCLPNVAHVFNADTEKRTFHTIRDVQAGEELTITYIAPHLSRLKRGFALAKYGFTCECPVCEDTENGRRLSAMFAQLHWLDKEMKKLEKSGSWLDFNRLAKQMVQIHEVVGMHSFELAVSYGDVARSYDQLGDKKAAAEWFEKELEVERYCAGEDHPRSVALAEKMEKRRHLLAP